MLQYTITKGDHMTKTMTLNDYANERCGVVMFWVSVGNPTGDYTPLNYPDLDFAARRGLLDLTGIVHDSGDWWWDGKGEPTDDWVNHITQLNAYVSARRWSALVEEYESGY